MAAWMIRQPAVWFVAVFGAAAVMAMTAPATNDPVQRVAEALVIGSIALLGAAVIDRSLVFGAVALVSGFIACLLLIDPRRYLDAAVWTIAGGSVLIALAVAVVLRRAGFDWWVVGASAGLAVGTGALFVGYDTELFPLGFGLIGLAVAAVVAAGTWVEYATDDAYADRSAVGVRRALVAAGRRAVGDGTAADVPAVSEIPSLFYDGDDRGRRLARFYGLMVFASAIASLGVLADSTAVVIGAMLVAPLMTPLMGTSLSLAVGWHHRVVTSTIVVVTGAAVPVVVGLLSTAVLGPGVDAGTNSQIASRVDPSLLDLAIALAAGAAGAYAHSRRDVSDSLPGVAVAIALVPPLAVVGACIQLGEFDLAGGASLLFLTNVLAIISMGALTFVATGVASQLRDRSDSIGHWVITFAVAGLAVLWSLVASTAASNERGFRETQAKRIAEEWAGDDYRVESVESEGSVLTIAMSGAEAPDDVAVSDLADRLEMSLDGMTVELDVDLAVAVTVTD